MDTRGDRTVTQDAADEAGEPADAELVAAARGGDQAAFERLVARYQRIADGYARHLLDHAEAVEDMVQESFLKAYRALGTLEDPARFAVWLKSILWRECRRWIEGQVRRRASLRALREDGPPPELVDLADGAEFAEEDERESPWLAELSQAVASLSEANRRALALFYILDEPQERIARFLAVPVGTIKRRLHDSRRSIAASIDAPALDDAQRRRVIADLRRLLAAHSTPLPADPSAPAEDHT